MICLVFSGSRVILKIETATDLSHPENLLASSGPVFWGISQHSDPEEGLRAGQNVDEKCADVQHCIWDPSKNLRTLDTQEHHPGTEALWSWNSFGTTVIREIFIVEIILLAKNYEKYFC